MQTGGDMQNTEQMGLTEPSTQLLLGSGVLSDAVTAAMHAVQPGSMYWGDATAQPGPAMSSQDMSADPDGLHQDSGMPAHLAGTFTWQVDIIPSHQHGSRSTFVVDIVLLLAG